MNDWRAQITWSRRKAGGQLDELVHRLGLEGTGYSALGLKLNGQRVALRLDFEEVGRARLENTVEGRLRERQLVAVEVTAKFERGVEQKEEEEPEGAPSIELRRETKTDREDKRSGLTVEIQTGFSGFDHAVFIDNDSSEADARRVLSKEATRQAVLRLLDANVGTRPRHQSVTITTTGVTIRHVVQNQYVDSGPLLEAIEDLLIIARAGGPKDARPGRRGENLAVLSVAFAALAIMYCLWVWLGYRSSFLPLLVGGVVGAGAGFFTRPLLENLVRGDSGSGRRAWQMLAAVVVGVGGFSGAALAHVNVLLDDEKPTVRRGVVTRVWEKPGKNGGQLIDVRYPEGTVSFRWSGYVRAGQHYTERHHPGAFGFEWVDGVEVQ